MAQADAVTLKAVVCVRGMLGNVGVALACGLCLLPAAIAAGCQGPEPTLIAATAATSKPAPAATVTLPPRPTPTPSPAPTATATAATAPTATATPSATATTTATTEPTTPPDDLSRFGPPDPEAGAAVASEALVAGQAFQLEVASTPAERARGLMGRKRIPDDYAMLFVFDAESRLSFWMKGTLIPLDILFLDSHGVVVDVQTMTPQIGASDADLVTYVSARPARYAIEMNAGLAEVLGVAIGAAVLFD